MSPRLDAKTMALLTAAAVAAVGRPVRLRRVRYVRHEPPTRWQRRQRGFGGWSGR